MRKFVFGSMLGLSIIAGSLAVATPASATLWRNFASPAGTSFFLNLPNNINRGQAAHIFTQTNLTSQTWSFSPDPARPGFSRLVNGLHPPPPNTTLLLGVSGNNMNNGTAIIDWTPTGEANQSWNPVNMGFNDDLGGPCFVFINANSPSGRTVVMGVSGGIITNNQPVIIWDWLGHNDQIWCAH
jgi:hypothetical protein